jgi:hypothetical protein
MRTKVCLCAFLTVFAVSATWAAETITYTYDARGRLVTVARSGTANNGVTAQYAYDKADNRTTVSTSGSPNGTPPPPPPPPPPSNNPPVANPDNGGTMQRCSMKTVAVTANDTDPDGDYPLTVTNAWASGDMSASVASSTSVSIESGDSIGAKTVNYTIRDSRGATANGTISITVQSGGVCQ